MKKILLFGLVTFLVFGDLSLVHAQTIHEDYRATWKAKVLEVVSEKTEVIPGTGTEHLIQEIKAEILEGEKEGNVVTFTNDYFELDEGDKFLMNYLVDINGNERFVPLNIYRVGPLLWMILVFVMAVLVFGGWQGLRSLVALFGSFLAIFFVLIPGLLSGWNPLIASFVVATIVLFFAIFFTHGFGRESVVAFVGTMIAVFLTTIFAIIAVSVTKLSGFATEEAVYLNFNTYGELNLTALLLGAIIIGVLGVLDDIAITQAAVVSELYDTDENLSKSEAYKKAIRVGREHVGALVNTLVLAYTGASLPLLLLFSMSDIPVESVLNMEIFATEIVRTIVGSVGLIMTVPTVTILAVLFLKGHKPKTLIHKH